MSPNERSLAYLRKVGYVVGVLEHWNAFAKIRMDLWGFGDLICLKQGVPPMIVQTTTATNAAARRKKILANPIAKLWVRNGGEIAVHGWAQRGPRGKRKVWTPEPEWITLDMFEEVKS